MPDRFPVPMSQELSPSSVVKSPFGTSIKISIFSPFQSSSPPSAWVNLCLGHLHWGCGMVTFFSHSRLAPPTLNSYWFGPPQDWRGDGWERRDKKWICVTGEITLGMQGTQLLALSSMKFFHQLHSLVCYHCLTFLQRNVAVLLLCGYE